MTGLDAGRDCAFILKLGVRSCTSYSCLYCESVPGRVLSLSPLTCRVSFSVPRGHSVFNGTQLTIYRTRYGRLTRAKTPLLRSLSTRNIFAQSFPV